MSDVNYDDLMTQAQLAQHLNVDPRTINNWAKRAASTSFPKPKEQLGKYKFYSVTEVEHWFKLWSKATTNMGWKSHGTR